MAVKNLIDDLRGPPIPEIISRNDFTLEDFEYLLNKHLSECSDNSSYYDNYSEKVPFEYVLKNLDKPWSWFKLSKNESLTYDIYLSLRHKKWDPVFIKYNKGLKRSKQIKEILNIIVLPQELIEIIVDY